VTIFDSLNLWTFKINSVTYNVSARIPEKFESGKAVIGIFSKDISLKLPKNLEFSVSGLVRRNY
jgi:hypothetical protein